QLNLSLRRPHTFKSHLLTPGKPKTDTVAPLPQIIKGIRPPKKNPPSPNIESQTSKEKMEHPKPRGLERFISRPTQIFQRIAQENANSHDSQHYEVVPNQSFDHTGETKSHSCSSDSIPVPGTSMCLRHQLIFHLKGGGIRCNEMLRKLSDLKQRPYKRALRRKLKNSWKTFLKVTDKITSSFRATPTAYVG
uniref:Uncharacterized protein n=1 Tax=Sus scrofa TaxID=9823 RepID=A0A8D1WA34_PIG